MLTEHEEKNVWRSALASLLRDDWAAAFHIGGTHDADADTFDMAGRAKIVLGLSNKPDEETLRLARIAQPKILARVHGSLLPPLRVAAGMCFCFGGSRVVNWTLEHLAVPENIGVPTLESCDAVRMIVAWALTQRSILDYRRGGFVSTVQVIGSADGSCEYCAAAQRMYYLADAPEIPYEYCEEEGGCKCAVIIAPEQIRRLT